MGTRTRNERLRAAEANRIESLQSQRDNLLTALRCASEMLHAISQGKSYKAGEYLDRLYGIDQAIKGNVDCADCGAPLPGPYGTVGVSMARTRPGVLLCSKCGALEALRDFVPAANL